MSVDNLTKLSHRTLDAALTRATKSTCWGRPIAQQGGPGKTQFTNLVWTHQLILPMVHEEEAAMAQTAHAHC